MRACRPRFVKQATLLLALIAFLAGSMSSVAVRAQDRTLQESFASAAREWRVPEPLLLAVAYNVSRWEDHGGAPSVAGGYGPMHLLAPAALRGFGGRGDDLLRATSPAVNETTLLTAAALLGSDPALLRSDAAQNIRGGAALLAQYARQTTGKLPTNLADWYGAVARYSGAKDEAVAFDFANAVYATMRQGATRTTASGEQVTLQALSVAPNRATARPLLLRRAPSVRAECPSGLDCVYVPAAYQTNSSDPTDYGNYDYASRPDDGLPVRYIVIHNTEIDYNTTLRVFQNPANYVSAHYLVRSSDGQVAQLLRPKNVGWHAGNWYVNGESIGIEHEGIAIEGASWYSEQMYRASARLVRYLAQKYRIPIDRAHIIGHDEIPGPAPANQAGMHWDPGPFWDWAHYMELLGSPIANGVPPADSPILTIKPDFASNRPPMTYCYDQEKDDCRDVPVEGANFIYLYSAPSFSAPLVTNSYLGGDPSRANNWANKAVTGQQFVSAGRQGDWQAIYYGGGVAWLYNPQNAVTAQSGGITITPKAGLESIPVYGRAYPEHEAYPTGVVTQTIVPIYEMPAGQTYVATDFVDGAYYWAPTYAITPEAAPHQVVRGEMLYYQISFNHRFAFVKASDVEVRSFRSVR